MCTVVGDQTTNYAQMVKLVDTRDLKSLGLNIRAGSTPALGTTPKKMLQASFFILALPKKQAAQAPSCQAFSNSRSKPQSGLFYPFPAIKAHQITYTFQHAAALPADYLIKTTSTCNAAMPPQFHLAVGSC